MEWQGEECVNVHMCNNVRTVHVCLSLTLKSDQKIISVSFLKQQHFYIFIFQFLLIFAQDSARIDDSYQAEDKRIFQNVGDGGKVSLTLLTRCTCLTPGGSSGADLVAVVTVALPRVIQR